MKRLKEFEQGNARLKKQLTEETLDNPMLKHVALEKVVTLAGRKRLVGKLHARYPVSQRLPGDSDQPQGGSMCAVTVFSGFCPGGLIFGRCGI